MYVYHMLIGTMFLILYVPSNIMLIDKNQLEFSRYFPTVSSQSDRLHFLYFLQFFYNIKILTPSLLSVPVATRACNSERCAQ